jgi:hypothetical protein
MLLSAKARNIPIPRQQSLPALPAEHRYWAAAVNITNGSFNNPLWIRPIMFSVIDTRGKLHQARAVYFDNLGEYRSFHILAPYGRQGVQDFVRVVFSLPRDVKPRRLQILRITPDRNAESLTGGIVVNLNTP